MAYVDPPTFVASDPLAAAELNVLSDDIRALSAVQEGVTFSGVQLYITSQESIADTTATAVDWHAEQFDYGGWWSTGDTITVPAGAIPTGYTALALLVFARARFGDDATGNRRLNVLRNAASFGQRTYNGLDGGDDTDVSMSEVTIAQAGDTITMEVYHNAGHALNIVAADITILRYAPAY